MPGRACPCLREISTLLEWIYSSDPVARNLRTYVRLILHEARWHSGSEWLEYDKVFRQQAAMDPTLPWNELNASLLASTVLSLQSNQGLFCSLRQEAEHTESHYALAFFQVPGYLSDTQHRPSSRSYVNPTLPLCPTIPGATARRTVKPETLERICASWNKNQCAFPESCTFKHACATCRRHGHRPRNHYQLIWHLSGCLFIQVL